MLEVEALEGVLLHELDDGGGEVLADIAKPAGDVGTGRAEAASKCSTLPALLKTVLEGFCLRFSQAVKSGVAGNGIRDDPLPINEGGGIGYVFPWNSRGQLRYRL